jgi:hypothetical protein
MQPVSKPLLTNLLLHLLDSTELQKRGAFCFPRCHPGTNVFFPKHFEVRVNLLRQVGFHPPRRKKIPHETLNLR